MGQPIIITNLEHSAADLRRLMSKEKDGQVVRRLLALALILGGHSRTEAAEMSGMERQTLGDWVHRDNAEGLAGLRSGGWHWTGAAFERGSNGAIARVGGERTRS